MYRWTSAWARRVVIAAAVLFAAVPGSSAANGLNYTTVFKDHVVYGTTPQAVWRYMVSQPIDDPDDGPALANITHEHSIDITTTSSRGACAVRNLNFTWHFVITLPKAVDYPEMSSGTARMWREFLAKARWHELHRRAIFLSCGASFVSAAERLTTPTCSGLEAKVRSYIDKEYAVCMTKQRAFGVADGLSIARLGLIRLGRGY